MSVALVAPAGASTPNVGAAPRVAAGGSIGLRLVDVPVAARTDPRANIYIVDRIAPGAAIHRRIEVSNTTASNVRVALYSSAATIANGAFLGSAGHTPNELSTWTSVGPGVLDVSAGGRMMALVTLRVPRDAAPGERYGVVWAEARSTAAGGVVDVSRVGIRLYVSVGPGGAPASNFTIRSLTAERTPDGRPVVVATVHNSGGRALDMSGSLRLSNGPAGLSAGPFPAALGVTLAIGDTEPVTVALDRQIPAGPWDARITLQSGLLARSAQATITFPAAGKGPAVTVLPSVPRRSWPVAVFAGVAALATAAGFVLARKHARPRRPVGRLA